MTLIFSTCWLYNDQLFLMGKYQDTLILSNLSLGYDLLYSDKQSASGLKYVFTFSIKLLAVASLIVVLKGNM